MGIQIKEVRLKQKMSQEELSEKSGISRTIISGLENGTIKNTTINTLKAIARALDTTIDAIFSP